MSAKDPQNLRHCVGWALRRPESKVIEESFELAPKSVSGATTTNGQRKGVPNSWSSNSKAAGTKTCNISTAHLNTDRLMVKLSHSIQVIRAFK